MRTSVKIGTVVAGYVIAFLIGCAAVAIHVVATSADSQGSDGMYAFGDSLLFLAVFAVAAVPPTCAALFFLRSHRLFWRTFAVMALAIASTGLAATIVYLAGHGAPAGSALHPWSAFAVLRILVAPLFALLFFLACFFAQSRFTRIALIAATVVEAAGFVCVAAIWVYPMHT